jgi:anthranilate synthase component 1
MQQQYTRRPLLPFYSDILADMETPVSAYCKTVRRPYSFLLESVTGGEQVARFSFIGIDPYMVMIQRGEKALLKHMTDGNARDEELS